jgi:hypothetical protein
MNQTGLANEETTVKRENPYSSNEQAKDVNTSNRNSPAQSSNKPFANAGANIADLSKRPSSGH